LPRANLVIGKGLLTKQSNFLLVATSGRTFVQTPFTEITSQPRRFKLSSRVIEVTIDWEHSKSDLKVPLNTVFLTLDFKTL
jgi:hypothetical protein